MAAKMCPVCGASYGPETAFCASDGAKLMAAAEATSILADRDPLVRTLIGGRYRILKRIGEGGMGMVYLAEHEAIEKRVAIKVLKEQYAQREDVVRRFQQEAKSASRVKHEGVLEIFDFGRTDDHRFFLAMELLDGDDLAQILERDGTIEPPRAARLGVKMARALAAAHGKGVIHRDMKPENVFVRTADDGYDRIKIVDFGIAQLRADGEQATELEAKVPGRKLTKTGMIFGTPEYMSPEQAGGKQIDGRVDLYALGIILFEMLTGRTPFQGETFMAILSAHLMNPIPVLADAAPPGFHCSQELEEVVRHALAKDRNQRYATMGDLAEALLNTPEGQMDEVRTAAALQRSSQFPSGIPGPGGHIAPTDWRMRSNAPPPMPQPTPGTPQVIHTPPPMNAYAPQLGAVTRGPPVPYGPAQSVPPPMSNSPGTMSGYARANTNVGTPRSDAPTMMSGEVPLLSAQQAAGTAAVSAVPERRSGGAVAWVVTLAMLGLLGGGGWFAYRTWFSGTSSAPASSGSTPANASSAASSSSASTKQTSDPAPASTSVALVGSNAPPRGDKVKLHVDPIDAVVEKLVGKDWVQVCDHDSAKSGACDVRVDPSEMVDLRASKPGATGQKKVLADHDQVVTFTLTSAALPPIPPKPPTSASTKPTQDLCEFTLDEGIKVWRPCAKP